MHGGVRINPGLTVADVDPATPEVSSPTLARFRAPCEAVPAIAGSMRSGARGAFEKLSPRTARMMRSLNPSTHASIDSGKRTLRLRRPGAEVIVLPQIQNLADDVARGGSRGPMRRARSVRQPRLTVRGVSPFPR